MPKKNTIPSMFQNRLRKYRDKILIQYEFDFQCKQISWRDCSKIVRYCSLYFLSIGVKKGDRIVLLSENRPEWIFSDLAITSVGGINVTMLSSCGYSRLRMILEECNPKVIMVDRLEILKGIPINNFVKKIIVFGAVDAMPNGLFIDFNSCLMKGRKLDTKRKKILFNTRMNRIYKDDIASIIYNIIATGEYKGVMLTHENLLANCESFAKMIHIKENDVSFHFNPFSLIFGRVCGYYLQLYQGATIYLSDSQRKIINFKDSGVTVISASPIVYAKIYKNLCLKIRGLPYIKRKIIVWAIKIQKAHIKDFAKNKRRSLFLLLKFLFVRTLVNFAVSGKIKKYFFKTKSRLFIVGGAYLDRKITRLFYYLGLHLLEGYGLTECGVVSVNPLRKRKIETVGKILPNIKIRIEKDGEILIAGSNVMKGYYNDPVGTGKIIKDGWLHTGDIGSLDRDCFLSLAGLKKNIFITTNGANINPDIIEGLLKSDEYIDDVAVFGDKKPYLVALVIPNLSLLQNYMTLKLSLNDYLLVRRPEVRKFIAQRITEALSGLSRFEQIREFKLLNVKPLCGLKVSSAIIKGRRNIIYNKYEKLINEMYSKN